MRASEQAAFDRRRADAARLREAAEALRSSAAQAGYAGLLRDIPRVPGEPVTAQVA